MYIEAYIPAAIIQIVFQLQCHLATTTTEIQNVFIRLQFRKPAQVARKLRTGGLKTSQRAHVPAQVQRRQVCFVIQ